MEFSYFNHLVLRNCSRYNSASFHRFIIWHSLPCTQNLFYSVPGMQLPPGNAGHRPLTSFSQLPPRRRSGVWWQTHQGCKCCTINNYKARKMSVREDLFSFVSENSLDLNRLNLSIHLWFSLLLQNLTKLTQLMILIF